MSSTVVVIPCFNEGSRLATGKFLAFLRRHRAVRLLFVNDGSSDDTGDVLHRLRELAGPGGGVAIHELPGNRGKAEAVRQGCLAAFATGADRIGYWDADLATPLETIPDFLAVLDRQPRTEMVCGARVQLLGRSIQRGCLRHYLGRIFATAASWTLGLAVYDTQCGAKLFRATPRMHAVFTRPFLTRWLIDVEILARLIAADRAEDSARTVAETVYELPLPQWHEVAGSKVKPLDFFKALLELRAIYRHYLSGDASWQPTSVATPPALPILSTRKAA
jgi:glycosyltransferase involved in cell wall biosynthesis